MKESNNSVKKEVILELRGLGTLESLKLADLIDSKPVTDTDIANILLRGNRPEYVEIFLGVFAPEEIKKQWDNWSFKEYFARQPINSMSHAEARNYNKRKHDEEKERLQTMKIIIDKKIKNCKILSEKREWEKLYDFFFKSKKR